MDVFDVRDQLIRDYKEFTSSFVHILDGRVREHVEQRIQDGYQWPDPWLSLNPNFASGGSIPDLVNRDLLDPECTRIFRDKERDPVVLRTSHIVMMLISRPTQRRQYTSGPRQ